MTGDIRSCVYQGVLHHFLEGRNTTLCQKMAEQMRVIDESRASAIPYKCGVCEARAIDIEARRERG